MTSTPDADEHREHDATQRDRLLTGARAVTRAAVTEFLGRLGEGNPERIAELFSDTVDWQLDWPTEGHPAVPWIRQRSTRAGIAEHFRMLDDFHVPDERGGLAPRVLVDGLDAVVLVRSARPCGSPAGPTAPAAHRTSPSTVA